MVADRCRARFYIADKPAVISHDSAGGGPYRLKIYLCPVGYGHYFILRRIIRKQFIKRFLNLFLVTKLQESHQVKENEHYYRERVSDHKPSFYFITTIDLYVVPYVEIACSKKFSCDLNEFSQICICFSSHIASYFRPQVYPHIVI